MNTAIERSFFDPHDFDVSAIVFLPACIGDGDSVDPQDVEAHLPAGPARDYLIRSMQAHGIR